MTRMEEYAFTKADKALPETPVKTIRGTFDSTWKDQLLTWNGISMTYDSIGNMVKKGNTTYTWTQGRKLSTVNNGKKIQYFYDHTGRRARKTVDGVTTDFRMAGELLMSQKAGDVTTYFSYDSAGNLIGMSAGRERYFYTRNAQNDITGLIDENGTSVVQYQYDSWGKLLGITGSLASTIGKRNPFRYRGYYYDDETGMYYLQSRYYDPEIKRFICADDIDTVTVSLETVYNKNLYTYCMNDPVNRLDEDGHLSIPNWAKIIIGTATTVAAVSVTVVTGGAALPVLVGVAASTVSGTILGYATGGKQGAIDGAADGVMWGGIGALGAATVSAIKTYREYRRTINTYSALKRQYKGSGMEAHHVIEKRLVKDSNWQASQMPSIELTKSIHRIYTNKWRKALPYGTKYSSKLTYKIKLYRVSNSIYRGSRVLRMAARYTIFKMRPK